LAVDDYHPVAAKFLCRHSSPSKIMPGPGHQYHTRVNLSSQPCRGDVLAALRALTLV
jgi:hypothetical protein